MIMRHNTLLEPMDISTHHANRDGPKHIKQRKFGVATFRCVDARSTATFKVGVFHLRSGQDKMAIPGKDRAHKAAFKMSVLSQVWKKLYGDASTLAEDTLSVLVGDQNMDRKLVQTALMPIELDENAGIAILNPASGILRGDGPGRGRAGV